MNNVLTSSKLIFFKTENHLHNEYNSFDTSSSCPRPYFSLGIVLKGEGEYKDCNDNRIISVKEGDIIFVPVTSRYISKWQGNP